MTRKRAKKRKPAVRPCRSCSEFFQPYRGYQRFCSGLCRNLFWRTKNKSIRFATESIIDIQTRLRVIEAKLGIKEKS